MLGKPLDGQLLKLLALLVGADVHDALLLAVQHLLHQAGQNAPAAGAGHHVGLCHRGGFLRERLGVAAGQHRHGAGVLALGAAQPFAAFLVAEIGHGAAVDNVDVGLLAGGHHGIAVCLKQLGHRPGFVLVHLAAQGIKADAHGDNSYLFVLPRTQGRGNDLSFSLLYRNPPQSATPRRASYFGALPHRLEYRSCPPGGNTNPTRQGEAAQP